MEHTWEVVGIGATENTPYMVRFTFNAASAMSFMKIMEMAETLCAEIDPLITLIGLVREDAVE